MTDIKDIAMVDKGVTGMSAVYQQDVIAIFDQAISNIRMKLSDLKRRQRQAKNRLDKVKRVATDLQSTEKYRQSYYAACLETEAWERRLAIAIARRDKALMDSGYYKNGGSR